MFYTDARSGFDMNRVGAKYYEVNHGFHNNKKAGVGSYTLYQPRS